MIATNIAYSAMPKALVSSSGKEVPASAPRRVPKDQPQYGKITKPKKYFLLIKCGFDELTAKISSVIKAEKKTFCQE